MFGIHVCRMWSHREAHVSSPADAQWKKVPVRHALVNQASGLWLHHQRILATIVINITVGTIIGIIEGKHVLPHRIAPKTHWNGSVLSRFYPVNDSFRLRIIANEINRIANYEGEKRCEAQCSFISRDTVVE